MTNPTPPGDAPQSKGILDKLGDIAAEKILPKLVELLWPKLEDLFVRVLFPKLVALFPTFAVAVADEFAKRIPGIQAVEDIAGSAEQLRQKVNEATPGNLDIPSLDQLGGWLKQFGIGR